VSGKGFSPLTLWAWRVASRTELAANGKNEAAHGGGLARKDTMAKDLRELSIEELDKSSGGMAVTIEKVTAAVEIVGTGGILSGAAMGAVVKAVISAISDARY
jgi:hypothetical protein